MMGQEFAGVRIKIAAVELIIRRMLKPDVADVAAGAVVIDWCSPGLMRLTGY